MYLIVVIFWNMDSSMVPWRYGTFFFFFDKWYGSYYDLNSLCVDIGSVPGSDP